MWSLKACPMIRTSGPSQRSRSSHAWSASLVGTLATLALEKYSIRCIVQRLRLPNGSNWMLTAFIVPPRAELRGFIGVQKSMESDEVGLVSVDIVYLSALSEIGTVTRSSWHILLGRPTTPALLTREPCRVLDSSQFHPCSVHVDLSRRWLWQQL